MLGSLRHVIPFMSTRESLSAQDLLSNIDWHTTTDDTRRSSQLSPVITQPVYTCTEQRAEAEVRIVQYMRFLCNIPQIAFGAIVSNEYVSKLRSVDVLSDHILHHAAMRFPCHSVGQNTLLTAPRPILLEVADRNSISTLAQVHLAVLEVITRHVSLGLRHASVSVVEARYRDPVTKTVVGTEEQASIGVVAAHFVQAAVALMKCTHGREDRHVCVAMHVCHHM